VGDVVGAGWRVVRLLDAASYLIACPTCSRRRRMEEARLAAEPPQQCRTCGFDRRVEERRVRCQRRKGDIINGWEITGDLPLHRTTGYRVRCPLCDVTADRTTHEMRSKQCTCVRRAEIIEARNRGQREAHRRRRVKRMEGRVDLPFGEDHAAQHAVAVHGAMTHQQIAEVLGVSRQRVRQIEAEAVAKLARTVQTREWSGLWDLWEHAGERAISHWDRMMDLLAPGDEVIHAGDAGSDDTTSGSGCGVAGDGQGCGSGVRSGDHRAQPASAPAARDGDGTRVDGGGGGAGRGEKGVL